jgi:hypothetical protein
MMHINYYRGYNNFMSISMSMSMSTSVSMSVSMDTNTDIAMTGQEHGIMISLMD